MAGPLAQISAEQIAAQKLPDQSQAAAKKTGTSKFDQVLKSQGAEDPQKTGQVQASQQIQHVDKARHVEKAGSIEKAALNKVDSHKLTDNRLTAKGIDPVAQKTDVSKTSSLLQGMVQNMERGQVSIDKLIAGGLSGKNFSNTEMLAMQASMYKYTQELELTGKVVEKATSGLKDTLKTQV
jgi:hypothetical protein